MWRVRLRKTWVPSDSPGWEEEFRWLKAWTKAERQENLFEEWDC